MALSPKLGSSCSQVKSQKTGKLGDKESLLYSGCWKPGRSVTLSQKPAPTPNPLTVLPLTVSGRELLRRSFRVYRWKEGLHQNSTVSSGRHWWSEQQHLDCLKNN